MDIPVNENVVIEKVKFRDILASLKNIIAGDNTSKDEKIIDEKLQKVYEVEKELGATDRMANLAKELEKHEDSTTKKRRTRRNSVKINNSIEENIRLTENEIKDERKNEEKEL